MSEFDRLGMFTPDLPDGAIPLRHSGSRFVNREYSWLQFNWRVLEESQNENHPLLERLRFLSISSTNLDEFFMVRVAGIAGQERAGIETRSVDGLLPGEQLEGLLVEIGRLQEAQHACYASLRRELAASGVSVLDLDALAEADIAWLEKEFYASIFPVMTPL